MPQSPARRPVAGARPPQSSRKSTYSGPRRPFRAAGRPAGKPASEAEHEILFQQYFKSVNPQKTYAAQLKRANNGNHYLVLTEGKRDASTGEVRKTRVFVYSEDFVEFFKLLQSTAQFIRANPVPDEVKKKRDRYWARQGPDDGRVAKTNPTTPAPTSAPATQVGG